MRISQHGILEPYITQNYVLTTHFSDHTVIIRLVEIKTFTRILEWLNFHTKFDENIPDGW
jgi:hypothetical protein